MPQSIMTNLPGAARTRFTHAIWLRPCHPALLGLVLGGWAAIPAFSQDLRNDAGHLELDPINITARDSVGGPALDAPTQTGSLLGLTGFQTPASVDSVKGVVLRRTNAVDLNRALVENSPGLSYAGGHGSGGSTIRMRGFAGHNSVIRLYDEIRLLPASGSVSYPFDNWTVDRVEVLHGPAAVLYGTGGIGGAINFIPKKPLTDQRRNEAMLTYGSHNRRGLALGSAGPINDRLAYSLDVHAVRGDGAREGNDLRSFALSSALRWQTTEDLSITASIDYGDNQPDTYFGTPLIDGQIDERLRWINYNASDAKIRYRDAIAQIRMEWTPNAALTVRNTLYGVYSNRYWKNIESAAYDPVTGMVNLSDYIAVRHRHQQIGNRLDATIQGQLGGFEAQTVLGLDLTKIKFTNTNNSPYDTPLDAVSLVDLLNPQRGAFGSHVMAMTTDSDTKRAMLFWDSRLTLSQSLSLVAGVSFDRTDFTNHARDYSGAFNTGNGRVGAVWTPVPDLAVYAQLSYAKETLGNLLTQSASNVEQVPTTARQAELGLKAHLPDQRGALTLAAYRIERRNILSSDPDDRANTLQIGEMSSSGIEASFDYDLGAGVRLQANAALNRAKYDDFWQGATDYSGKRVPNMPGRIANLQASWDITPAWQLRGGLHYAGSAYTDNQNTVTRPSYTVLNAGLEWRATDLAVVDLSINNLTDKVYADGGGRTSLTLAPGRNATLSVRMDF